MSVFVPSALYCGCCLLLGGSWARAGAKPLDEALFQRIRAYKAGKNPGDVQNVAGMVVASLKDPELRVAIERQFIAMLRSADATTDCKRFVCRQLMTIGTAKAVPALATLLPDKNLSHMARYALERMQCPEAGKALRDALPRTQGRTLIGVINSLGARRDRQAIPALIRHLKRRDPEVAGAATRALGKIGGEEAVEALAAARANATGRLRQAIDDAYLRCADRFLTDGKRDRAKAIYEALYKPSERRNVRAAALRGLVAVGGEKAIALIAKSLMGDDPAMRAVAVSYIRDVPGTEATKAFAAQLPRLPVQAQPLVIGALAVRGDAAAAPAVRVAAKSRDEPVRIAALRALAKLGRASDVPLLADAAAGASRGEADAARRTLALLGGADVDKAILARVRGARAKVRVEMIRLLAVRGVEAAVPALLVAATDADKAVSQEAFNALAKVAGEKSLPALVDLMVRAKQEPLRKAAERAVITVSRKIENEDARTAALLAGVPKASGAGKAALLRVLGRFGGEKALAVVRAALNDKDPQVQDAAFRTMKDWPDASPADDLLKIARTAKSQTRRVLALRGYVSMLALPSARPIVEILKRYEQAMGLAPNAAEKRRVLSAMSNLCHPAVLKALKPYLADPALRAEAEAAINKVKKAMKAPAKVTASHNPGKARNAIDGKPGTRWDTGRAMAGGEWFMLELGMEQAITKITLDTTGSRGDYPRGYEVYISRDGKHWGQPVVKGQGRKPITEISFKPTFGRFIKIVQTGRTAGLFWSIHELKLETKENDVK